LHRRDWSIVSSSDDTHNLRDHDLDSLENHISKKVGQLQHRGSDLQATIQFFTNIMLNYFDTSITLMHLDGSTKKLLTSFSLVTAPEFEQGKIN